MTTVVIKVGNSEIKILVPPNAIVTLVPEVQVAEAPNPPASLPLQLQTRASVLPTELSSGSGEGPTEGTEGASAEAAPAEPKVNTGQPAGNTTEASNRAANDETIKNPPKVAEIAGQEGQQASSKPEEKSSKTQSAKVNPSELLSVVDTGLKRGEAKAKAAGLVESAPQAGKSSVPPEKLERAREIANRLYTYALEGGSGEGE